MSLKFISVVCICNWFIHYHVLFLELFYLIYFKNEDCVSVVKEKAIIDDKKNVGMNCHVKDGSRIYEGTVVTFGK